MRNGNNSPAEKRIATLAYFDIERIRSEFENVLLLDFDAAESAADRYESGDTVVLCGAYRHACLGTAKRVLEEKGVKVLYHSTASIPLFPAIDELDGLRPDELFIEQEITAIFPEA
jgi:hypothetical protein